MQSDHDLSLEKIHIRKHINPSLEYDMVHKLHAKAMTMEDFHHQIGFAHTSSRSWINVSNCVKNGDNDPPSLFADKENTNPAQLPKTYHGHSIFEAPVSIQFPV